MGVWGAVRLFPAALVVSIVWPVRVCVGLGKRRGEGGNVLLFFLCVYLVKGKILVRWSSCDLDCPTEEGAGTVNSLFF